MASLVEFKDRLQWLIDNKKISQAAFAKEIQTGESRVSDWLRGVTKAPQRKTLKKLSDFFGCNFDWLVRGAGDPFPPSKTATAEIKTSFQAKKATKDQDNTLAQLNRLRFKQQCGSVFFDDFFDYIAENYGEDQEGVTTFLNELYKSHPNYRSWEEEKKKRENDKNKGLDNLSAES